MRSSLGSPLAAKFADHADFALEHGGIGQVLFLANTLPSSVLPYFLWNPLFHAIDQARGFAFINYNPMNTWLYYPLIFSLCVIIVGMLGEFYTRNRASLSWAARQ